MLTGYRPACLLDLDIVEEGLRHEDRVEAEAQTGRSAAQALAQSFAYSAECNTIVDEGLVVGVCGVSFTQNKDVGIPWMLVTDDFDKSMETKAALFLRESRRMVARWQTKYLRLHNHVHVKNAKAIRWLGFLGFTINKTVPSLINGELFYPFYKEAY